MGRLTNLQQRAGQIIFTLIKKGDMFCHTGLGHYGHHPDPGEVDLPPETQPTPPSATLVGTTITHLRDPDHHSTGGVADNIYINYFSLALSLFRR